MKNRRSEPPWVSSAAALLLAATLLPSAAAAQPAQRFGAGPRTLAMAGAAAALADDGWAVVDNPAGLAAAARQTVEAGWLALRDGLEVSGAAGTAQSAAEPGCAQLSLAVRPPLDGILRERVSLGFALSVDPGDPLVVELPDPSRSRFLLREGQQRWQAVFGLALRLRGDLALGLSVDSVTALQGDVTVQRDGLGTPGPRGAAALGGAAAPHLGLRYQPRARLGFGLAYRAPLAASLRWSDEVETASGPATLQREAEVLQSPGRWLLGASYRARPWLLLGLDLAWLRWSAMEQPSLQSAGRSPGIGQDPGGALLPAAPATALQDSLELRLGAELRRPWELWELRLRAGLGYLSSPVPEGEGGPLLDGDTLVLAGGLGLARRVGTWTAHLDLGLQLQKLAERSELAADGTALQGRGQVTALALSLGVAR